MVGEFMVEFDSIRALPFIAKKDATISFRCLNQMSEYFNKTKYPIYLKEFNDDYKSIKISNRSDLINYLILHAIIHDAIPEDNKRIFFKELSYHDK